MSPADALREIAAMVPGTSAGKSMVILANNYDRGWSGVPSVLDSLIERRSRYFLDKDERAALDLAIEALS